MGKNERFYPISSLKVQLSMTKKGVFCMKGLFYRMMQGLKGALSRKRGRLGILLLIGAGLFLGMVLGLLFSDGPEVVEEVEMTREQIFTTLLREPNLFHFPMEFPEEGLVDDEGRVCPGEARTSPQQELDLTVHELLYLAPPSAGELTTSYGWYRHPRFGDWRFNPGLDFQGEEVLASFGGRVVEVVYDEYSGYAVFLAHGTDVMTGYSNLDQILVEYGQMVEKGQLIALQNGEGPGNDLHFQILDGGEPLDPLYYLSQGK